jgi:hypothetical protein
MGNRHKVVFLCYCIFSACRSDEKKEDEFYTTFQESHWEIVPLIKPYAVWGNSPVFQNGIWILGSKDKSIRPDIQDVKYVSVADSVICLLTGVVGPIDTTVKKMARIGADMYYTAWFVVDVKKKKEIGFPSEAQFNKYLELNEYQPPHWLKLDSLSKELDKKGTRFPWWPKNRSSDG